MEIQLRYIQKFSKGGFLFLIFTGVYLVTAGQYLEGNIQYGWQAPQRVIFNGPYKDKISIGDSVILTISGTCDLRPYEVEKKRGGFLGIGRKRYREVKHDRHNADDLNIYTSIDGTNWAISQKLIDRKTYLLNTNVEAGSFFENMKKEFLLHSFIQEPGKNLVLGSANLIIRMEIHSRGRIAQILNYLKQYPLEDFPKVRELLEQGIVMQQHPDELCDALFQFYAVSQQDVFAKMKTDLLDYLLMKSPNNLSIRSRLAKAYLDDKDFIPAMEEAKKAIAGILAIDPGKRTLGDHQLLAENYAVLGQAALEKDLGIQANAAQIAVSYYQQALQELKLANLSNSQIYRDVLTTEVKALQRIGSLVAFQEAAQELENYLFPNRLK